MLVFARRTILLVESGVANPRTHLFRLGLQEIPDGHWTTQEKHFHELRGVSVDSPEFHRDWS